MARWKWKKALVVSIYRCVVDDTGNAIKGEWSVVLYNWGSLISLLSANDWLKHRRA